MGILNSISEEKLVTVFMPVYNKGLYIACALDSVLAQEVNFEYEILIIDDCSTDNSTKIIQEYIRKYPDKIKFIQNEKNLRMLANILKGWKIIKTKYWTMLDPDDYWLGSTKMQSAINYLEVHPKIVGYTTNTYLDYGEREKFPMFDGDSKDYKWKDSIYFAHTSSIFFRTSVFIQKDLNKIDKYVGTELERCFQGDTFRHLYYLSRGKIHYENRIESVYRVLKSGDWAGKSIIEQDIENAKVTYAMYLFFQRKDSEFFLSVSKYYLNKMFCSLRETSKVSKRRVTVKHFFYIILNKIKSIGSENRRNTTKFLESIFCVKNEGIYKVIGIFGIRIKIKNKHEEILKLVAYIKRDIYEIFKRR